MHFSFMYLSAFVFYLYLYLCNHMIWILPRRRAPWTGSSWLGPGEDSYYSMSHSQLYCFSSGISFPWIFIFPVFLLVFLSPEYLYFLYFFSYFIILYLPIYYYYSILHSQLYCFSSGISFPWTFIFPVFLLIFHSPVFNYLLLLLHITLTTLLPFFRYFFPLNIYISCIFFLIFHCPVFTYPYYFFISHPQPYL